MRYLLGLNLLNYGEIIKYVGYKNFMLQANKFNKHPILTVNVIECFFFFLFFYFNYIFKITIEITSSNTTCLKEFFFLR
jgi:hypothetical protein